MVCYTVSPSVAQNCELAFRAVSDTFSNMADTVRKRRRKGTTAAGRKVEAYVIDPSPHRHILDFRRCNLGPIRVLGRYHYTKAAHGLPRHTHGEMIEIIYVASGSQTYEVNNQEYPLVGGDVFVTFPWELHGTGTHPESPGIVYWMVLSVPSARRCFLGLPAAEGRQLLERLLSSPRQFRGRNTLLPTLLLLFEAHGKLRNPLRALEMRTLLLRFLVEVVASAQAEHPSEPSLHIRTALKCIEDHLEQPLSLTELARQARISLPRLKSKFKQEVGVTPGDYMTRRRIARAAQLLYETKAPVTDIAMRLGFPSSQYFATVFKRYTLHSPRFARAVRLAV